MKKKKYILFRALNKRFSKVEVVQGHIHLTTKDAIMLNRAYKTAGMPYRVAEV